MREYLRRSPGLNEIAELEQEIKASKDSLRKAKEQKKGEILKDDPTFKTCTQEEKEVKITHLWRDIEAIEDFKRESTRISEMEAELAHKRAARVEDSDLAKLQSAVKKVSYDEKNLDAFLDKLVAAFHSENDPACPYPRHYTEQVLLAMGWLNGTGEKTELLSLYHGLKSFMSEAGKSNLHDPQRQAQWLDHRYTSEDYIGFAKAALTLTPEKRAEHFLAHSEELAFLAHGRPLFDSNALPTIGFKQTPYEHPKSKAKTTFPDCMEMAVLNAMLNALAGGVGNSFDVGSLEANLNAKGYTMHPGLKDFLTKYPDPSRVNEPIAHQDWAKLVSNIPGIKYNRPEGATHKYCEMFPTVSNVLAVYEHILFSHPKPGHTEQTLSRSQKLTRICKVLSRPNRKVEWKLKGSQSAKDLDSTEPPHQKDTNLVLEFAINGQPKYDWKINSGHSQVDPNASDTSDWRAGVGLEMVKQSGHPLHSRGCLEPQTQQRSYRPIKTSSSLSVGLSGIEIFSTPSR